MVKETANKNLLVVWVFQLFQCADAVLVVQVYSLNSFCESAAPKVFHFLVAALLLYPQSVEFRVPFFERRCLCLKAPPFVSTTFQCLDFVLWDGFNLAQVNARQFWFHGCGLGAVIAQWLQEPPILPSLTSTSPEVRTSRHVEVDCSSAFCIWWSSPTQLGVIHRPVVGALEHLKTLPQCQQLPVNLFPLLTVLRSFEEQTMHTFHTN